MKHQVNKSELRMLVKENEEIDIRRSVKESELISILMGETPMDSSMKCPLLEVKQSMETYIQNNLRKMRTQLPQCTGTCTTYGCPDGVVVNCYLQMKPLLKEIK